MSGHRMQNDMSVAQWNIPDPGTGNAIDSSTTGVCSLTLADAGETNTLAAPTKAGLILTLNCAVVGTPGTDTRVVTVASAYDETGSTTITFSAAGSFVTLVSVKTAASTYAWRVVACDNVAGPVSTMVGGIPPAGGTTIALARPGCVHTGGVPATASTQGFNATPVATEIYYSELFVPCNMSVTGIAVFNGSVASDDWHRALLDADGALVTGSATGAVTSSGTDVYQKVPFTGGAITVPGPATYYVAGICDGTTDRYNAHGEGATELGFTTGMVAGKITAQTYAAIPATNTLTLTFTTDLGPIASLY